MSEQIINPAAQTKLAEVETLAAELGRAEAQLESGYGSLAFGLKEVADNRYWEGAYKSFGEYITHLGDTHKIGRAQIYNFLSTARTLEGDVTVEQLSAMGISKALALTSAKKGNDGAVTEATLAAALAPKVSVNDLNKLLFESGILIAPDDSSWLDLEMEFMVDDSERQVIQSAISAARHTDPVTRSDIKPFAQRKDIMLKLCESYLADHSHLVIEGETV